MRASSCILRSSSAFGQNCFFCLQGENGQYNDFIHAHFFFICTWPNYFSRKPKKLKKDKKSKANKIQIFNKTLKIDWWIFMNIKKIRTFFITYYIYKNLNTFHFLEVRARNYKYYMISRSKYLFNDK